MMRALYDALESEVVSPKAQVVLTAIASTSSILCAQLERTHRTRVVVRSTGSDQRLYDQKVSAQRTSVFDRRSTQSSGTREKPIVSDRFSRTADDAHASA